MKKLYSLILASCILYMCVAPGVVRASVNTTAYEQGLAYLVNNGFDGKMIGLMSEEEICKFANAQYTNTETHYYAYVHDTTNDTYTIEQHDEEYYLNHTQSKSRATNTKENSWMKLTLRTSHLGQGWIDVRCEYTWLSNPFVRYTDVIAITFDSRVVLQEGTGRAKLKWTNSSGLLTTVDYDSEVKYSGSGAYVLVDIPGWGNTDMYGYMSVDGKVNYISNSTVSFNNWGYYAHKTSVVDLSFSVSLPAGGGITLTPKDIFDVADVGLMTTSAPS